MREVIILFMCMAFGILAWGANTDRLAEAEDQTVQTKCCQWCPDMNNPGQFYCCNVCHTEGGETEVVACR
jgi:hypothetical protein